MIIALYKYKDLQINFWKNHGIKISIVDTNYPYVNIADKNELIKIRDMINEVIESME
jgi:hypothetical protein